MPLTDRILRELAQAGEHRLTFDVLVQRLEVRSIMDVRRAVGELAASGLLTTFEINGVVFVEAPGTEADA